jgi:nucleotide-binding universal stress UspA family protein
MRILLAIDGSPSADRALDLVAALPWRDGGRVRIVSVAPSRAEILGVPWSIAGPSSIVEAEDDVLRVHRDTLADAERELRSVRSDLVIEPVLLRGRPASVIVDEARDMSADLLVVGHRGQGRWASALLGSVSAEIVDQAPCPVLVARDDRIGPVVLADDGSPHARAAETMMTDCPLFAGLPVSVVSVVEVAYPDVAAVAPILYADAIDAFARSSAAETASMEATSAAAVDRLRASGLDAEAVVREGDPAREIVAVARDRQAGVIVVGTRGQTGLQRLILGSVAKKVLLHAPCSVLVVRGGIRVPRPAVERHEEQELISPFG